MRYLTKALKSYKNEKQTLWEKLYTCDQLDWFFDAYYSVLSFIERCKRSWAYAKLGHKNYDFDALTIEHYLLFKLKRVQKCLINGTCDLTVEMGPMKMKALKLCIKLLEKLNENDYSRFMDMHDKKWGELHTWFEPVNDGNPHSGSYWRSSRPKAVTPEEKEQERKEFLEASYADAREEEKHRRLVYRIIEKYIRYWWD